MADISVERKTDGGAGTWIWAILAIVAVVGLMAWLAMQPATTTQIVADETGGAAAGGTLGAGANAVDLAALSANPDAYLNQEVVVRGAEVAAPLGARAFWADVPGANPFLIIVGQDIQGIMPTTGESYNVQGRVQPVTDQIVNDWAQAGVINQAATSEASFATHYLLGSQVERAGAAAPATAPGGS